MPTDTPSSHYTVIKASAGSGKTYRLTEELTERLARVNADGTPEVRPSQIIATTFTRKAAAELSGRIRERLVDKGQLTQASAVPTALIGTVNSITGRILQEFAVDAGRSPDLDVLSETAQARAFSLAVDSVIAGAEDAHRPLLVRMGYDLGPNDDPTYNPGRVNWARTVREVIDLARSNDIDPTEFDNLAEVSLQGLYAALDTAAESGGEVGAGDARSYVTGKIREITASLQSQLDEGSIAKRSASPLQELLGPAERFVLDMTSRPGARERVTWKEWFAAANGDVPKATRNTTKPWETAFADAVPAPVFAADPGLRSDLADLTRLVFSTAATCLHAYADYKDSLGLIDFTDQEQLTLHLLREDSPQGRVVRETLADRFRILVVDEFQDTSPLQLALFTELGRLVDEVIWVGDPKQSIYGFRGADPSLMTSALDVITAEGGATDILHHSWRTHAVPLDLTNRLFSRVFPGEPGPDNPNSEVWLDIPEQLTDRHAGHDPGEVQVWTPAKGARWNALDPWFARITRGLHDLERSEGVPARGRAVLTRTNSHADKLREALRRWNIPTEGGGTPLLNTREGTTVRAACAWLIDDADTQALVELITVLSDHAAHSTWFDTLTSAEKAPDIDARKAWLRTWAQDESLAALAALRPALPQLTVMQTVVAVIDALDLRRRVASWTDPAERTGAVNGILQAVSDYSSDAEGAGEPVTLPGFLLSLDPDSHERDDTVPSTRAARNPDAIVVSTIHQSKGLEWDTVVVAPPLPSDRFRAAGVWVDAPEQLSLSEPLAGRELRFWPETLLTSTALTETLAATPVQEARHRAAQREERRLLYVAMTRSRRRTVLAPHRGLKDLMTFADSPFGLCEVNGVELADADGDTAGSPASGLQILWPDPDGPATDDEVAQCSDVVDCPVRQVSHDVDALTDLLRERTQRPVHPSALVDDDRRTTPADHPADGSPILPATFAASGVEASGELAAAATVTPVADLGDALVDGGGPEWNRVGDCIHSYLAAPLDALDDDQKKTVASRLVASWKVGDRVTPETVIETGDRWTTWLRERFPGANAASEVPFTWTNDNHQRAEGWLDELLTLPDGSRVIIDHKTYPGKNPVDHVRENYIGQMATYQRALTDIDGREPAAILIHLPLLGHVLEVRLP